jgi:hypothetical protein
LRSGKWYLNHGAIGCAGSMNMTDGTFVNDTFADRPFPGQGKIGVCSHCFSVTLPKTQEVTIFAF